MSIATCINPITPPMTAWRPTTPAAVATPVNHRDDLADSRSAADETKRPEALREVGQREADQDACEDVGDHVVQGSRASPSPRPVATTRRSSQSANA